MGYNRRVMKKKKNRLEEYQFLFELENIRVNAS
jgi:hypothetical protein